MIKILGNIYVSFITGILWLLFCGYAIFNWDHVTAWGKAMVICPPIGQAIGMFFESKTWIKIRLWLNI